MPFLFPNSLNNYEARMSDISLSPLLDIESNLSPLPDRVRLLAAAGLTEPAFYRNLKSPKSRGPAGACVSVPPLT